MIQSSGEISVSTPANIDRIAQQSVQQFSSAQYRSALCSTDQRCVVQISDV